MNDLKVDEEDTEISNRLNIPEQDRNRGKC